MAVTVWAGIEHDKQEDNLLQQVIYFGEEVVKHWHETKVHKGTNHTQSRGVEVPVDDRSYSGHYWAIDKRRMENN